MSKVYPNGVEAVAETSLTVGGGEFFTILGPSGSGKSTLLRLIAGLEQPTRGSIWIDGRDVTGLSPRDRNIAMVFQEPALYPYLSVRDNLSFGLRARGVGRTEAGERVEPVATAMGLGGLLDRRPQTLSGGQRQRVALGRAVVREPAVFLFDEPLSRLDAPLRASVRAELIDLHRRLGATMLHVTHDQGEALAVSDRLAVLEAGHVVQVGRPREVYGSPATRFVAGFLGGPPMNLLPCDLVETDGALRLDVTGVDRAAVSVPVGPEWLGVDRLRKSVGRRVVLGTRPEDVALGLGDDAFEATSHTRLAAEVEVQRVEFLGYQTIATVGLGPHPVAVRLPESGLRVEPGVRYRLVFDPARVYWFDAETGLALTP